MSNVICGGDPCQPLMGQGYAEEARAGGSELSRERTQAPGQDDRHHTDGQSGSTTEHGGIKGARRAYRIDRCRTFTKRTRADDLESWIEAAKETFSIPSKGFGGEKGSVCVLDGADAESSPAGGVYGPEGPARCVPGMDAASVEEGSSSLLDYRLTQGEKEKASFKRLWWGYVSSLIDTYQFRAVVAGHVVKLYRYHVAQVCQKGKSCRDRQKREDRTEEEKQRDRRRNLLRARNGLIDTINANVDRPWGELLKFFTMSFKDDIFDLKEANNEFNKFIKRLEYHIKRKVHYTVIARFQDGKRPGGKLGGRDGVIHYHLLFYDLPYVPHGELTGIWGRGFVWINAVDDVDNIGVYMVEGYMGKEMDDDRLNGQKHYWSSRGLVKPLVIYGSKDLSASLGIQDREPVYCKTFTSEYVGVVDYEQYNLKREGKVYARKEKSGSTGICGSSRVDNGTPWAGVGLVPLLREGVSPGRGTVGP